jgi:hypothetical protein
MTKVYCSISKTVVYKNLFPNRVQLFQFSRAYLLVFRLGDFLLRFMVLLTSSSLYVLQFSSASQSCARLRLRQFIHSSSEVVPLLASPINKSNRTKKRYLYLGHLLISQDKF